MLDYLYLRKLKNKDDDEGGETKTRSIEGMKLQTGEKARAERNKRLKEIYMHDARLATTATKHTNKLF